jgi:hypothetical protein
MNEQNAAEKQFCGAIAWVPILLKVKKHFARFGIKVRIYTCFV